MFIGDPCFEPTGAISKAGLPVLKSTQEVRYISAEYGIVITMPVGTLTDGGTIPKCLRLGLHPHDQQFMLGYFLHDHICRCAGKVKYSQMTSTGLYECSLPLTRREADGLLLEASRETDAPILKSYAVYTGARIGSIAYRKAWGSGF